MRQRRERGHAGDPPAGRGGRGCRQRRIVEPRRPAQDEAEHVCDFGGQLQPSRGDQVEPALVLAHDAGQAGMAQALLHGPESAAPGPDEDQAGGIETDAGQRRRVKITSRRDPQYRADTARQHGGGEQRRGGTVLDGGATSEQLVHGAKGETLAGQMRVKLGNAERQARGHRIGAGPAFQRRDLRAQGRHSLRPHRLHPSLLSSYTDLNVS